MAGTVPLSMTQQFDASGNILAGGKLWIIQAGTTSTPQNSYQDSALTIPWSNPIVLSAAGRIPQFFLADGSIKIRLEDKNGIPQVTQDGIIVTGASSGGGGGSPVDPTTVLQTGWVQPIYGTGIVAGFVRCNGRTIGSATSGATERAVADTLALFTFLYQQDVNLAVSGGRGASAGADFAANKTIALPDMRGRVLSGMDDMGNVQAGRLTIIAGTVLGTGGGSQTQALIATDLPSITSAGAATGISVSPPAGNSVPYALTGSVVNNPGAPTSGGGNSPFTSAGSGALWSPAAALTGSGSASVTSNNTGGTNHANLQPTMALTLYIKL
jgi:microcystin-dependent protein